MVGFRLLGYVENPGLFRLLEEPPTQPVGLESLLGSHALRVVSKLESSLPGSQFAAELKKLTLDEVTQRYS